MFQEIVLKRREQIFFLLSEGAQVTQHIWDVVKQVGESVIL